jgi:hypothetical protein
MDMSLGEQLRAYKGTVGFSDDGEVARISDSNISDLGKRFYKVGLLETYNMLMPHT